MTVWSGEWGPVVPWLITGVSVAYVAYLHCKLRKEQALHTRHLMNPDKHDRKHVFKVGEHLHKGKKLSLCRCWRSKTFPFCDGTHKEYNKETGECVGSVVVKWEDDEEDMETQTKTLVEQDIQSMNASTELSSLEMIDSNGENGSSSRDSPQSTGDDNNIQILDN